MNTTDLKKLVGENHQQEVTALMEETGQLPSGVKLKNPMITLVLAIFLGMFAIDRLYQGGVKIFLCKLAMLLMTLGTWWIVDIGYSIKSTQERNYDRIIAAQMPQAA